MPSPVRRLVPALGVTQIISWGSLYYAIAVLGSSLRSELGLSSAALFGAYSSSLLLSALVAHPVGRAIDRHGGRVVMCAGSLIAAGALFAIAHVQSAVELYFAWAIAGVAMAMTMYDAAFATLSQHSGRAYRIALTALTLMGGLASTVFWPISLKGLEWFGWRDTFIGFAVLQLLVCLPLHYLFIPRLPSPQGAAGIATVSDAGALPLRSRRRAFVALAAAFACNGFIVSVLTVHLISLLQGKGFALDTAVWVASFFGPMQVAGRVLEFSVGRRFSPRSIGTASLWLLVFALLVLLALHDQLAMALFFAVAFGLSNGVVTIVRGTVPAELFGRVGYGRTLGGLATPALVARAVAPLAFAPLASPGTAPFGWLLALLAIALLSVGAFGIAVKVR